MPTRRTKIARSILPEISAATLSAVSEGLFPMPEGEEAWDEYLHWQYIMWEDEKKKILDQCGDFVLAEWIRKRPGTRPQWWWDRQGQDSPRRLDARLYESEAACLKRLGLLTPAEEKRLGPEDFEPDET